MSTTTQQPQQLENNSIENAANFIRKKLEEVKPKQLVLRTSDIHSQKDLEAIIANESNMHMLSDKLSGLDIKMQKIKDPSDPRQEALEIRVSDSEGEERFEVPEEEEAEEATPVRPATGGSGGKGQPSGTSDQPSGTSDQPSGTSDQPSGTSDQPSGTSDQPVITNRSYPRPLPEPVKTVDIAQIRNFSDVLKNITVQRIAYESWTRKNLVLVNSNQPIDRALSRINTHNIHSLPVVDANSNSGAVLGVIDILDIISALSESWDNNSTRAQRREKLVTPISDLLSRKAHPPTYIMSVYTSIHEALREFAQSKLTRVLIVERRLEKTVIQQDKPEEFVLGILTQSDLIRFVAENIMWIKKEKVFQATLRQLNLGQRKPIVVSPTILAYQAFQEIHRNEGREGVALVDNNGRLIANISASNIKGMTRANIQLLFRPLTDFLGRDRKRGWWQLPICTTLDTTLENIILQFVGTKIHRMYIVDNEGRPTGEVSLFDVIEQLGSL